GGGRPRRARGRRGRALREVDLAVTGAQQRAAGRRASEAAEVAAVALLSRIEHAVAAEWRGRRCGGGRRRRGGGPRRRGGGRPRRARGGRRRGDLGRALDRDLTAADEGACARRPGERRAAADGQLRAGCGDERAYIVLRAEVHGVAGDV